MTDLSEPILIAADELEVYARDLFLAAGFDEEEASVTAASLVLSNLYGHDSHGVIRVHEYIHALNHKELTPGVDLDVVTEHTSSLVADGQKGLGQVQMVRFLDRLCKKAQATGCASGALRNSGHIGRVGEWTEALAEKGFAAFVGVNDNGVFQVVAPPGGKQPRTSTNPLAFGVPLQNGEVFSLDMSTSTVAMGKMRLWHIADQDCPEGLIQDHDGNSTTNPTVMFDDPKGALKPFGGAQDYKGFGLSMMMDCLAAGLSGGYTPPAPDDAELLNNAIVMVWDCNSFAGLSHMQEQAEKYIAYVKATTPVNPANPVRVAGDRAKAEKQQRDKNGIPLSTGTVQKLCIRSYKLSVPVPAVFKDIYESCDF